MSARQSPSTRAVLAGNLFRIGWRCVPLRGLNALSFALAVIAFFAISVGTASLILTNAIYDYRAELSAARNPAWPQQTPPQLLWQPLSMSIGDSNVYASLIEPLHDELDPPPGVAQLPGPGQAVLSPALEDLLIQHGMPDRFGQPVGVIGSDGLASPSELLAYAQPMEPVSEDPHSAALPMAGFGQGQGDVSWPIGEDLYDRDAAEFWALITFLMILPGGIALAAAARVADPPTLRRHILLARLGASQSARAAIALPRAAAAALTSAVAVVALAIAASTTSLSPPFTAYVIDSSIVAAEFPSILISILIIHILALLLLVLITTERLGNLTATRLVAPADRPAMGRTIALVVTLAVQPWIIGLSGDRTVIALSTFAAAVVAVWCLPAALAAFFMYSAGRFARIRLASGDVGKFIGWRLTEYRSRGLARLLAAVSALVIVVGHAAVVLTLFTGTSDEAVETLDRIGTSLLVMEPAGADQADIGDFAAARGLHLIHLARDMDRNRVALTGECDTFKLLGIECTSGELPSGEPSSAHMSELLRWYPSTQLEVAVGASVVDHADGMFVLASPDLSDLDVDEIANDAFHELSSGTRVDVLGASALRGGRDLQDKSRWLFVFGVPGVLTLLVAATVTWAAAVIEESREVTRNPLLADQHSTFSGISTVRIAYPVAMGGVVGAGATAWLLAPHVQSGVADMPTGFLVITAVTALFVAALGRSAASRLMAHASRETWTD